MESIVWKNIKSTLIQTVASIIIMSFITWVVNPDATITIANSSNSSNQNVATILIKNITKDEYLKEFDIIIDNQVGIYNVQYNGEKYNIDKNVIAVPQILPDDSIVFTLTTEQELDSSNIIVAKNSQKIGINYFENYFNWYIYTIILILCYCAINSFLAYKTDKKNIKYAEEQSKKMDSLESEVKSEQNKLDHTLKKQIVFDKLYVKEMADLETELAFYKKIVVKMSGNSMTKEEMEKIISKELKTFNKKTIKHVDYKYIVDLVECISKSEN